MGVLKQNLFNEVAARQKKPKDVMTSLHDDCYRDVIIPMEAAISCYDNYKALFRENASKESWDLGSGGLQGGRRTRVLLFPEEGWARGTPGIEWGLKVNRWWGRFCTVTEHRRGTAVSTLARRTENGDGTVTIAGRFKRAHDPDFRLHLTAQVSRGDFEQGYVMTGALQLGDLKGEGRLQITHFAGVPRHQD